MSRWTVPANWVDVSAPDASTPCKFTGVLAVSLTGTATPDGS